MQYPRPLARGGSQERSARARLEAEALFSLSAPKPDASTPVVVLKKRRALPSAGQAEAQESGLEPQAEELRAPKVHRLSSKQLLAGTEPTEPNGSVAEPPSEALPPVTQPRRRRRQLHGRVTIVQPAVVQAP